MPANPLPESHDLLLGPDLRDVVPVPDEAILHYGEGPLAIGFLSALNLGLFEAANGYWWVGLRDGNCHEHDRWFFMLPEPHASQDFDTLKVVSFSRCRPLAEFLQNEEEDLDGAPSLTDYLADMINTVAYTRGGDQLKNQLSNMGYLQAYQAFGWLPSAEIQQLAKAPWGPDLHDLVHHPDLWAQAHPEAADLPRELVLRLHGLGIYADALTRGEDWHQISSQ